MCQIKNTCWKQNNANFFLRFLSVMHAVDFFTRLNSFCFFLKLFRKKNLTFFTKCRRLLEKAVKSQVSHSTWCFISQRYNQVFSANEKCDTSRPAAISSLLLINLRGWFYLLYERSKIRILGGLGFEEKVNRSGWVLHIFGRSVRFEFGFWWQLDLILKNLHQKI